MFRVFHGEVNERIERRSILFPCISKSDASSLLVRNKDFDNELGPTWGYLVSSIASILHAIMIRNDEIVVWVNQI